MRRSDKESRSMQISKTSKEELMLLIHGLRSIHVSDMEGVRARLQKQLEDELFTRYAVSLVAA